VELAARFGCNPFRRPASRPGAAETSSLLWCPLYRPLSSSPPPPSAVGGGGQIAHGEQFGDNATASSSSPGGGNVATQGVTQPTARIPGACVDLDGVGVSIGEASGGRLVTMMVETQPRRRAVAPAPARSHRWQARPRGNRRGRLQEVGDRVVRVSRLEHARHSCWRASPGAGATMVIDPRNCVLPPGIRAGEISRRIEHPQEAEAPRVRPTGCRGAVAVLAGSWRE
jgi:hypothetical protein